MNHLILFIVKNIISNLLVKKVIFFIALLSLITADLKAQTTSVPVGSLIIDMGVIPQTYENGLKPYGFVYELIDVLKIPVIWSINPLKSKDGVDFSVDGRDFRGGTFIVEEKFVADSNVQSSIDYWKSQGVISYITSSDVTVDVYKVLDIWPQWVVDAANGKIAANYLKLAGIPDSAYRTDLPSGLNSCDDLFILPHADPNWTDHGFLYDWTNSYNNGGNQGSLWVGCHAVSALEALKDPLDASRRMNFLTSDGLIKWTDHDHATGFGYSYNNSSNSYMQFIGTLDGASNDGSERVYLPAKTSSWAQTTSVSVWDDSQKDVLNGDSPGLAAIIAYGPAFGDDSKGMVMYQGGHDLNKKGEIAEKVSAIRAFLNFSFDARTEKAAQFTDNTVIPVIVEGGTTIEFDVEAVSAIPGDVYTFSWQSSCSNGSFNGTSNGLNNTSTSYITNPVISPEECIITVIATNSCGRQSYRSYGLKIVPPPKAPVAIDDNYSTFEGTSITFNPLENDVDDNFNLDPSTFTANTALSIPGEGQFQINANTQITFNPEINFIGVSTLNYTICDSTSEVDGGPFCDSATISVNVISSGCPLGETASVQTGHGANIISSKDWIKVTDALGPPDNKYSRSSKNKGFVIIDLGFNAQVGSQIVFRVFSDKGKSKNGVIDVATSSAGFPNSPMNVLNVITQDPATELVYYTVTEIGTRFVRIEGDKEFGLESIAFNYSACTNSSPNEGSLMISQYYENGKNNDFIEIKNLSNLPTKKKEYYLVFYKKKDDTNKAPKKGNIIEIEPLEPDEVRVYNKFKLEGNDIVLISKSKGANCFKDRVDIIGNQNNNWGKAKSFTKGGCATENTHIEFDLNDWIELEIDYVNNADSRQNVSLGTYNTGSVSWNGSSWSNNELPDRSRITHIDGPYTADLGSIEACDLIIQSDLNFNSNTTNSVLIYRDLIVNGSFVIGDQESLVTFDENAVLGLITKIEKSTVLGSIYDHTYWSSPVEGSQIGTVFSGVDLNRIFELKPDQINPIWSGTQYEHWWVASGTMKEIMGYTAQGSTTGIQTLYFTGIPNNGTYSKNLYYKGSPDSGQEKDNFNFLGNPYPTAIDIDLFLSNNAIVNEVTLWTHGTLNSGGEYNPADYIIYNLSGSSSPGVTRNIGSSQGFMVRSLANGSVVFNNELKLVGQNDQFYKEELKKIKLADINEPNRFWLKMMNDDEVSDDILIAFNEASTDGLDERYDSYASIDAKDVNLYSRLEAVKMTIQGLGSFDTNKSINLGYETKKVMKLTIELSKFEGVFNDVDVFLQDHLLNLTHDLKISNYSFNQTEIGEFNNRFSIRFSKGNILATDESLDLEGHFIIRQNQGLEIDTKNTVQTIRIYDILGRKLVEEQPNNHSFRLPSKTIKKGSILFIEATFEDQSVIRKKTIKL